MLTKKQIDDYYVSQMPMLTTIIKGVSYKQNKQYIDIDVALNEAYLHIIQNKEKLSTEKEVQKMLVNFINKSIIWTNSKLNKLERVNSIGDVTYDAADTIDNDLLNKIEIEEWYNEKMCILNMYRAQEKDKVKQIIFDTYFKKEIRKGIDLAKHLGVNKDYGCRYIREMKADIKAYYAEYIKNNNK